MAGYASRTDLSESVTSDLFLKVMAFEDGEGTLAALITADILGFSGEVAEAICERIKEKTGLDRSAILLNGSHTHSGPVPFRRWAPQDDPTPEVVQRYVEGLIDDAVAAALEALEEMRPARLSWGTGVAPFVMNRREFTDEGVKLGVNPRGLVDRSVPVLRVDGADGHPMAVVFGAAGHNVTNSSKSLSIDGDYAGYAQSYIESQCTDIHAMFVCGCAANANIHPKGTNEIARQHGETLGAEVCRMMADERELISGPLRVALERVDLPLCTFGSRAEIEQLAEDAHQWRRFFTDRALAMLDRGEALPTYYSAPFAMWQFGEDLTLVGLPGETLVEYVPLTERAIGPLRLWVAGYCNDLFGYLPPARVLAEGGYETRGLYLGVGIFSPEVEGAVCRAIERLAEAVGRPMSQTT